MAASTPAPTSAYRFQRAGQGWLLSFEGRQFITRHVGGLAYIAYLLGHPQEWIDVGQLYRAVHATADVEVDAVPEALFGAEDGWREGDPDDDLDALDTEAAADYRRRLRTLNEKAFGGKLTAEEQKEKRFLDQQLAGGTGLGGRTRRTGGTTTKLRSNVAHRIEGAFKAIEQEDARLGRYLRDHIETGTSCRYIGPADTTWVLD